MKVKKIKVWVDVGSHGGVFEFHLGMVANHYPHLMHVYSRPISPQLVPATLTYKIKTKKK